MTISYGKYVIIEKKEKEANIRPLYDELSSKAVILR